VGFGEGYQPVAVGVSGSLTRPPLDSATQRHVTSIPRTTTLYSSAINEGIAMGPGLSAVQRATELFSDPAVRAQVRAWHTENVPLIDMVDRLGFTDLVDNALRAAITGLSPAEVSSVRTAFLAEIERAAQSRQIIMPVECALTEVTGPVTVTPAEVDGRPIVRVT
jgi:hypothetical protein